MTRGLQLPVQSCPLCRGTGLEGRQVRLEKIGGHAVVLTTTRWCPTCKGTGGVWSDQA